MRFVLSLALIAVIGCGSKSNPVNGGNDAGVPTGGTDLGMPDLAGTTPTSMCDIAAQTGCAAGQKCIPDFSNGMSAQGACVPNGTAAEGAACTPNNSNMNQVNDNCLAGTICDNNGGSSVNLCRKICSGDAACTTAGQKCGVEYSRKWGVCMPSCALYGSDCPGGSDCSVPFDDVAATQMKSVGFFVCKKTGAGAVFSNCNNDTDCAVNLACDQNNNWCSPACDNTHACPMPPAVDGGPSSLTCAPYTNLPNGEGVCG